MFGLHNDESHPLTLFWNTWKNPAMCNTDREQCICSDQSSSSKFYELNCDHAK